MSESRRIHRLGHRAFVLFLSRRIKFAVFLFLVTAAAWFASEQWLSGLSALWGNYAAQVLLLISIAYLLFILLRTYMEYRAYTYSFLRNAFVVTRGYITRTETATLYHQIQNVNIERSMTDRMTGVSSIVIFLAGGQYDTPHTKIVLPAVAAQRARLVQKELLLRARRHAVGGEGEGDAYEPRRRRGIAS